MEESRTWGLEDLRTLGMNEWRNGKSETGGMEGMEKRRTGGLGNLRNGGSDDQRDGIL